MKKINWLNYFFFTRQHLVLRFIHADLPNFIHDTFRMLEKKPLIYKLKYQLNPGSDLLSANQF